VKKAQPHPIPYSELQVAVGGVVVLLGQVLGLKKALAGFSEDVIALAKEGVDLVSPSSPPSCTAAGAGAGATDYRPPRTEWCTGRSETCCSNNLPMAGNRPMHGADRR
jgi:hypothetical protein